MKELNSISNKIYLFVTAPFLDVWRLCEVIVLDVDLDYFMNKVASFIGESVTGRLPEEDYGMCVWKEDAVRHFIENNLGLSKKNKIKGCIVKGHNEALFFWNKLIDENKLKVPFSVVHVDSHADLGLGYLSSVDYIKNNLIKYPVENRFENRFYELDDIKKDIGIGDYLLYAIAFRWIDRLTYCANPNGEKNDYDWDILKEFKEKRILNIHVSQTIQLAYNDKMEMPYYQSSDEEKEAYWASAIKEPEVPFEIILTIDDVNYNGNFNFITVAQSPNYTPESADYILEILSEYIDQEI